MEKMLLYKKLLPAPHRRADYRAKTLPTVLEHISASLRLPI
jgi:hypothetical protein